MVARIFLLSALVVLVVISCADGPTLATQRVQADSMNQGVLHFDNDLTLERTTSIEDRVEFDGMIYTNVFHIHSDSLLVGGEVVADAGHSSDLYFSKGTGFVAADWMYPSYGEGMFYQIGKAQTLPYPTVRETAARYSFP